MASEQFNLHHSKRAPPLYVIHLFFYFKKKIIVRVIRFGSFIRGNNVWKWVVYFNCLPFFIPIFRLLFEN